MTAVRFEKRGHMYAVTFNYDPTMVELLKVSVPSYARKWVPARREWQILDHVHARYLGDMLRRMGHVTIGLDEPPKPKRDHTDDPDFWARQLFKRVGPGRSAAVYRALSKCFHPDTGTGDAQLQQELNDAHHEITQRRESA